MSQEDDIRQLNLEIAGLKERNQELSHALGHANASSSFHWRTAGSAAFLFLSLIILIPATLLIWLNRTLIDPSTYIQSVGPIIEQPAVQKAITTSATTAIFAHVNVNQLVSQYLPPQAKFLSGPIVTQVKNYTGQTIATVVASRQFNQLWIHANTQAHAVFIRVAQNPNATPNVNLSDLYQFIQTDLSHTALAPLLQHQLPSNIGNITVATVPALVKVPHYVNELSAWRWVFIALVVFLSALAVWLARVKRRALLGVGVVWMLGALLTLATVRITKGVMLADIQDPIYRDAADAIWPIVLHSLYTEIEVIFTIGLATVITAWVLGPSRLATAIRSRSQLWLSGSRERWFPEIDKAQPVHFLQSHRRPGEWTILGLAVIALIALAPLTPATIAIVVILAVLILLIFEFLATPKPTAHLPPT